MSSRENAGSPDVETRMVGIVLSIFLNTIGTFYQYLFSDLYTHTGIYLSLHSPLLYKFIYLARDFRI